MAGGKLRFVCRRRILDPIQLETTKLKRCLSYWDVTSMGVGSTLGAGVYVLVGVVAFRFAGPSVVLSFLMAALAALFAGLCYAELGSRMPRAGSAYVYSYVTLGQLAAFIVGWCSIIEFVFGAASVARVLSLYIDAMADKAVSSWFLATMPIAAANISPYFDLLSFAITIALGVLLVIGVRQSATVNNVFTGINIAVILFIIIAGATKANTGNWGVVESEVPVDHGTGGFFPHTMWGTFKGAAVCFYGFVGFNVINYTAEEVHEPRRTIPLAILSVLLIVFAAYGSVSIVLTMMVPYYQLEGMTSVATAFTLVGWEWAQWLVTVGAFFGICTSLYGSLYPLPRLLYSMASDGLFFHWFSKVNERSQPWTVGTVVITLIIAALAAILELEQLVLVMCFGTLFTFTIVACCVILLRYRSNLSGSPGGYIRQIFSCKRRLATKTTSNVIVIALVIYISLCIAIAAVNTFTSQSLIPSVVLHALAVLLVSTMALQPKTKEKLDFKTPLVPFVPCLSIYANVNLMIVINIDTWIRVAVCLLIGVPVYIICICCYKQKTTDYEDKDYVNKNGKSPVQIVVESPTPPDTIARSSNHGDHVQNEETQEAQAKIVRPYKGDEGIEQRVVVEYNEEKEAKIIDLLDQVLQAEENSYGEVISLKDNKDEKHVTSTENESVIHRKSLSELSDAGSDASLGNHGLSKYDVIAQVHREDLPRVNEEEERVDEDFPNDDDDEAVTAFNDSETNSRTDESGYSDTIDRTPLNGSVEDTKEAFYIPKPPPMDYRYFKIDESGYTDTIEKTPKNEYSDDTKETFYIPAPPPMDEKYFQPTSHKKFNTVPPKYSKPNEDDEDDARKPRLSIESNKSNSSFSDGNMRFGSSRQIKFMSKLNDIFQNKRTSEEEEAPRKRSHSMGTASDLELTEIPERPSISLDLKKEILSRETAQNLRPLNVEEPQTSEQSVPEVTEDLSMSREDLKSKLENIFAAGGPQLLKPRLIKSNPPTPEESYQTDNSSTESIQKLPKMGKNDTLKRQKAKFGEVLDSFRLSLNKDDPV